MSGKKPTPLRFLVVARTPSGPYPHPVEVGVHLDGVNSIVSFSIGPHAANAGGLVALSHVLDETRTGINPLFEQEFAAAELDWLVPRLIRLHGGEDVTDEIMSAYREQHGKRPETMHVSRHGS
ncbi:hypothetical protein Afil01_33030 [Actinorhabdospora filicis]|uniref:Uncharacterized protein n=1 Tax=Actinorhabdospora filicis TaxID=1785913 RepID=A0A9W6SME0_9ACTN|nr:hypothetical protein [Actinorhabdospora filicis]GLZ78496.1 hypothetical protein Afil01_33030 [Actinorhabdospora filicis]